MIGKWIEFSIRNPLVVIMISLALAGWGIYAAYDTPIDAIPDLGENQVIVFADWPGRSPREIEDQVTYPLSRKLQGLAGVRTLRSSSEFNGIGISALLHRIRWILSLMSSVIGGNTVKFSGVLLQHIKSRANGFMVIGVLCLGWNATAAPNSLLLRCAASLRLVRMSVLCS